MGKYIDAEKLKAHIQYLIKKDNYELFDVPELLSFIDSLQQDDAQVDKMLCSQIWWEEQGWIMIPPDATIEGIDSLLKQVKKKLQQKQLAEILEKFISDFIDKKDSENQGKWCEEDIIEAMKSSFDLGLNARKDG